MNNTTTPVTNTEGVCSSPMPQRGDKVRRARIISQITRICRRRRNAANGLPSLTTMNFKIEFADARERPAMAAGVQVGRERA
jgi:hypothetical protein